MADKKPWIDWSWLKVGPVLTNEQDRIAYEQNRQAPQQGPSMDEYLAGRRRLERDDIRNQNRMMSMNDEREAMLNHEEMLRNQEAMMVDAERQIAQTPFQDRGLLDQLFRSTPAEYEAYKQAAAPPAATGQGDGTTRGNGGPLRQPGSGGSSPGATPMEMISQPPGISSLPADQASAPPPNAQDPNSVPDPIEEIRRQRAMIDAIYPKPPANDMGQAAIDAEVAKEARRTELMAQLAFFSGVTAGAGENWKYMAQGMADAGSVYQKGFDRYQNALESRAKRMQSQANDQYDNDIKRSDAAVGLYKQKQDLEKSRMSENRQRIKDRQTDIDEYFKKRLDLSKGNDLVPTDQNTVDKILREWRMSRERGEIISMNEREKEEK